ncbi:hypothetical protein R1sor_009711 [Riccia sorocarpa]|uniref:Kinesin light chain n=1 Tax=Riccia sorocarpa TaxID=122646 RepID=A0ABD3HZE3_9MARC
MAMALRTRLKSMFYPPPNHCWRSLSPSWISGAQSDYHSWEQPKRRSDRARNSHLFREKEEIRSRYNFQASVKRRNFATLTKDIRVVVREPMQRWNIHQRFLSSENSDAGKKEKVDNGLTGEEEGIFTEEDRKAIEALGAKDVDELELEQLENLLESATLEDEGVGILYLKLGQEYDAAGETPQKILKCGEQALKVFNNKHKAGEDVRAEMGMSYHLIGTAYMRMEEYDKSFSFLRKSYDILEERGGENSRAAKCAVKFMIGEALSGMGKPDEALTHLRAAVAEQEAILGRDHVQLGRSYRQLAETLTHVMKHEEALPLVQKSIEIHTKSQGEESMEIAIDRRLLAVIYIGLEQHEKALEEHKIVRKILSKSDFGSQTVFVDIATADTEITLGKYDDAVASLETAIKQVEKGSAMHALALVNLAKVYERQGKKADADKYAEEVIKILEDKVLSNSDPLAVAEGYTELAALYERLTQTEKAIELLKKAHAIYTPIPHQKNAVAGTQAQIGMLLFFTGKVAEAVPYLENAVQTLEEAVGEQNFALAMVLNHLGVANVELERLEAATEHFERAKAIFNDVLGTDHDDTIAVARNLVNTYSLLDRLDEAIRYQEEVIREVEKKGDEFKEMLDDAKSHLLMLKDHQESGKPMSQTFGHDSPRHYGRIISD